MNKIWIVLKREFIQIVRSKAFIILTILGPVLMIGVLLVPLIVSNLKTGKPQRLAIVDHTDFMYQDLAPMLTNEELKPGFSVTKHQVPLVQQDEILQKLKQQLLDRELDAFLVIDKDILDTGKVHYYAKNVANFRTKGVLRSFLNRLTLRRRFAQLDIPEQVLSQKLRNIDFETVKVTREGASVDKGQGFWMSYILMFVIYITILMYGMWVMRAIIQEKSTRVVEVVISNIRPFQLLLGKILGICLVGLVQYAIWILMGYLIATNLTGLTGMFGLEAPTQAQAVADGLKPANFLNIPSSVPVFFVLFFILGYFFYSALYAVVASMVDNEQDSQGAQFPITMLLVLSMLLFPMVIESPDSTLAIALSMLPFVSPVLMFLRITILQPPAWQIAASILILLGSILLVIMLAAKIYRVGILMHGKKASLKLLVKCLKSK